MIVAWRLVKERHAADAFSGEGARRYGGRWNRPGTPVIYVSGSLSLAALELFVHLGRAQLGVRFVAFRVEVPDSVRIDTAQQLPPDWRAEPPAESTRALGSTWAKRAQSAVLCVPSAIVPQESNYVLDPLHADFARLVRSGPQPFSFDPRMWK